MNFNFWPFSRGRRNSADSILARARFIRTDTPGQGHLRLNLPLCRIGRAPDNDLCLENDSVSGRHAEVYHLPDGTFQICDLDSTNGTWVNGKRVRVQILNHGDIVELGEVRLHFRTSDA